MSIESYKGWNIKGIAQETIKEIEEEVERGETTYEDALGCLDDYLRDDFYAIQSRDTVHARAVISLVEVYIRETLEGRE